MSNSATVSDQGWAGRVEVAKRRRAGSCVWAARDNAPVGEIRLVVGGLHRHGGLYLRRLGTDNIRRFEIDPIEAL